MLVQTDQSARVDIYTRTTNAIIELLEKGVKPWEMPWHSSRHPNGGIWQSLRSNGQRYTGVNVLMLWVAGELGGFQSPYWITFNQAKELKANVKKGAKASRVVYANTYKKTETNSDGDEIERSIPFLKEYCVFNAEQVEGLPAHFYCPPAKEGKLLEARLASADMFINNTLAEIIYGGTRAFYSPLADKITMPEWENFKSKEGFYGTILHELIHWTNHEKRLDRKFEGGKRFGGEAYAIEELVAEIGAAFLCCELGITPEVREDHASYIENWLKALKSDKRAIFTAAAHAQKAAEYLHGLQK